MPTLSNSTAEMASLSSQGGQAARAQPDRRTRSASLSSESSGGGAPLNASLSDLSINDNTHQRSVDMGGSRTAELPHSAKGSGDITESIRGGIRQQQNFQIGKPPHDDEEVFNTSASMTQHILAGPVPVINQLATSEPQSITPIHAQPSPAERRHLVQGVDAQTYYPAEACIFVANLPESKSDTVLEVAVTKVFSAFGPVFVKIRRDPKNMPFAFCQYTDSKHAQKAQKEGKGLLIEGRPCRTEMVKANRCYVMFNREGHQVNVAEARSHLLQFGEISRLEPLHEEAVKAMKLPGSVFVEYTHFDPGRDIISAYRYHDEYGVVAYDLKKANPSQTSHYANYLARYEVDRRSIYVGNLPHNVENIEEILRHAASKVGTVEKIQIIRKEPRNEGGRPTVFAFVEYARPDEALIAVDHLRGTILVNNRIRVEKKKCADQGGQFRGPEQLPAHRGENTVSTFTDPNDDSTETIPATPARSLTVGSDTATSGGDVDQVTSQSVSPNPDYHPVIFTQRQAFATPTAYQQGRTFTSPTHSYQSGTFASPGGYDQAQYVSPSQAYQPAQYMSPNYALSPGDHHRSQYGQDNYQPATPQIPAGAHTPYHGGSVGSYYQGQSPNQFWHTPYLQDQNNGYHYYAGYHQQHRTPMGVPARSINVINAGQTPTRNVVPTAQHLNLESSDQSDKEVAEKNIEE
ncbi:putative RNA recognition domain-containing protein [Rosellinia necatrix]|uniref:Putative RNA recognition domain-containing protein n=1 Tax=Rosellinia necatrix TaxID=77044 RepID=A0A1S8AA66_ROSNE|nr:putative RNA recognition domain-containing protein [Rosellinia necatrix]